MPAPEAHPRLPLARAHFKWGKVNSRFGMMRGRAESGTLSRVNLILLESRELLVEGRVKLADRRADHIRAVLKAQPGHRIRVGVVDGRRGTAEVLSAGEAGVELRCELTEEVPSRPRVDLLLALPRPKVMRRLWAQLAALGVGRIILTNARKVERVYFDTHVLKPETYRPLLVEGLQQAQDTRLPEVTIHRQLKVLVEDELDTLFPRGVRLVADPSARHGIGDLIFPNAGGRVLVAIGPEGGWTEYEIALLREHGFGAVSMGQRTLRADTACVAMLSLLHEALRGRADSVSCS